MGWFKRSNQDDGGVDAVAAFWQWWAQARDRVAAAIESGEAAELATEISEYVHAIDDKLAWELGPGVESRHHLCVSTEGDAALRVVTERWLAQAPAADEVWEYYPARQPLPSLEDVQVAFNDVEVPFSEFAVAAEVDESRERVHVGIWHPALSRLPEETGMFACFLALDNALGEDGVETWVGGVDRLDSAPADGVSLVQLRDTVNELAASATGDRWAILEGELDDGSRIIVATNLALKRADHLLFDNHYEVVVTLDDPSDDGLTSAEEADELNAMEDDLVDALGPDAVYIGRETGQGVRIMHFHAAGLGPASDRILAWANKQAHHIEVQAHHDPGWDILHKWG